MEELRDKFMKQLFFAFIITLITITGYGQQKQTDYNHQKSYVDSAIFYFNACKTSKGIDTLVFVHGLRMLDSIPTDDNSIKRIEKAMEGFNGLKKSFFYNQIQISSSHLKTLMNTTKKLSMVKPSLTGMMLPQIPMTECTSLRPWEN